MTRIVFWNVERFGGFKFYSASVNPDADDPTQTQQATSVDRQNLLYDVITAVDPDILVMVEVAGARSTQSRLCQNTSNGKGGCATNKK